MAGNIKDGSCASSGSSVKVHNVLDLDGSSGEGGQDGGSNSVQNDGQGSGEPGYLCGSSEQVSKGIQVKSAKGTASALNGTRLGSLDVVYPDRESWYNIAVIPKRSGGKRIIEAPIPSLKVAQRKLYETVLLPRCKVSRHAFGCLKGRNVQQAAKPHLGAKIVLKLDLSDCFHTITETMVRDALSFQGLDNTSVNNACTLCINSRGVLPQGAPTSPSLANIVLLKPYSALNKLAERLGLKFTGYLDDLVFSGDKAQTALYPAIKILKQYGFEVKPSKIVFMRRKREVLGVCVAPGSTSTRLPKRTENKIRGLLHKFTVNPNLKRENRALLDHLHGLISFGVMLKDSRCIERYHPAIKALMS